MSHLLTFLIVASFLAPLLPPATCRGTAACCCASSAAPALAGARGSAGKAPGEPLARPATGFGRRCPCAPEMRGCPTEREPGTVPVTPPSKALQSTQPLPAPNPAFAHHSPPAARIPAPSAEPPPLLPPAALSGILRI